MCLKNMLHYFVIFILFCSTISVVAQGTCDPGTNTEIPKTLQTIEEIAQYTDDRITCMRDASIKAVKDLLRNYGLEIDKLYEEVIKTRETTKFLEEINSKEINNIMTIMGWVINSIEEKEQLIKAASAEMQAIASETMNGTMNEVDKEIKIAARIEVLQKESRTAFNSVFLVTNTNFMQFISTRYSNAIEIVKLLNCKRCGNVAPYIKDERINEENSRKASLIDTVKQVQEYEKAISQALLGFIDSSN